MLKRRSIKTKLFAALLLLLASVCSLTFSGLFGVKQYRGLAAWMIDANQELGFARDLESYARSMQEAHLEDDAAVDPGSFLLPRVKLDLRVEQTFDFNLFKDLFGPKLRDYESKATSTAYQESLLLEPEQRGQHLSRIRRNFEALDGGHDLTSRLAKLVDSTQTLTQELKERKPVFDATVKASYRRWNTITGACAAFAIALICVLLWSLWTMLVQPFRTLLDGSRLVARGEFEHRIFLDTGDELDELAEAMNAMSDKFQSAYARLDDLRKNLEQQVRDRTREVIRNEQLASVGFLAAGVAHEINNPLTSIAWAAESLDSQLDDWQGREDRGADHEFFEATQLTLRQIQEEAFRCKGITDRLLDFSRMSEVRREPTDLAKLVKDVAGLVGKVGEFRCKTIITHCEQSVVAEVSAHQIRQVVLNLITNALESVDRDGKVEITLRHDGTSAYITVQDDGCGMSEEVMTHLFEPFFTRRRDGTGTGLGLSITYRIVSQHGGKLIPFSQGEGKGSSMELVLPLLQESPDTITPHSKETWTHEIHQAA